MENKDWIIIALIGIILVFGVFGGVRSGGYGCPMLSLGYGGGYGIMLTWLIIIVLIVYFIIRIMNNIDGGRRRK